MEKIHCPFHEEATPSLVMYEKDYHCFGCGAHGPLKDLGREPGTPKPKYKENLQEGLNYIEGLEEREVRGHRFKCDDKGYYLVWPGGVYYKRRNWTDEGSKYKCPAGHAQPMFIVRDLRAGRLFLTEGEVNAMSVAAAFPEDSVMSPGSAGEFLRLTLKSLLTYCTAYCTVIVVVDKDGPGVAAACHTKGMLVGKVKEVRIALMETDANDLHTNYGLEKVREEINRAMSEML